MKDDLIRRSDAIRAVSKVDDYGDGIGFEVRSHCLVELETIPSADRPQGEWIPCSEKLPTIAGHYLCSFKKPKLIDNIYVELAYWTGDRWYGYLAPEIKAWMPLPEPWKGVDD